MSDLITALNIFYNYGNPTSPTHCEHDVLHVMIDPAIVSENDKIRLFALGFFPEGDCFQSYKFGSV